MKKLLILLLLLPINVIAISAKSSIAMDLDSKRILYENNSHEKHLIASITKIMTCIVAIENGNLDDIVTIDKDVLKSFGSAIYIMPGEQITLRDLLYGLMLRSGNDAAIEIANKVAGSMKNFTNLMNIKAQNIGMKDTIFYNNHGLETKEGKGNISTAYDMALLTKYAMKNKTFKKIFGTKKHIAKTNYRTYSWTNKNKLLHNQKYITGGKTGFTKKARRTLVTTGNKNNLNIVIVTLNDPNDFKDHQGLYENIFDKYKKITLINKNNFKIKKDKEYKDKELYIKNNITLPIKNNERDKINIIYELEKNNNCINKSKIGLVKIYINNKLINDETIYVNCNKNLKSSFWQKLIGWFKRW